MVHNCDISSDCVNSDGSFHCECHSGYTGDGITCTGMCICVCVYGLGAKGTSDMWTLTHQGHLFILATFSGSQKCPHFGVPLKSPSFSSSGCNIINMQILMSVWRGVITVMLTVTALIELGASSVNVFLAILAMGQLAMVMTVDRILIIMGSCSTRL